LSESLQSDTTMRLLLFNLVTDLDNPTQGFNTGWIRALARRVEFIHVITMRAGHVEVPGNVRVYSVGKEKGYSEPRRVIEFYRLLFRILRENRIDACFSHMIPIFTILAAPVLRPKSIPLVTWYAHRQVTPTLKLAHHFSDRIISSDEASYPYDKSKFIPVGQGIDTELFSPNSTPLDSPPLLLSVGRISPIKDLTTLVKAIHLLRQRGHSFRCAFVGSSPGRHDAYADEVRHKVQALNLEDSVQFVGPVPNHQLTQWYRRAFAHVNCSPSDHSLDKAVLEAMACGKSSLSSTLGFKETMGKWADRLLFQHGNPGDLAKKIEWLLRLSDEQTIGMSLRESVVKGHNLEQLADRVVALLGSLREPANLAEQIGTSEVRHR
jgi:glycosyltransferase involved in cell wall biosynthesis